MTILRPIVSAFPDKFAGRFLVIDGPDGAGKTTQVDLLADWLRERGAAVTRVRDPGGTPIGDRVRRILLDNDLAEMTPECETMLYMASRAQLVAQVVRPALAQGHCVLSDRYISSTIAYQGAGGMDPAAVRAVGEVAVGGLWPDLTITLDLSADDGLARLDGQPDRMEAKDPQFHRRVRELFLSQAAADPAAAVVVDAGGSIEQVHERIRRAVAEWAFA